MLRLQYPAAQLRDAFVLRPGGLDPPSVFTFFYTGGRSHVVRMRVVSATKHNESQSLADGRCFVETVQEVRKCLATSLIVSVNHDGA